MRKIPGAEAPQLSVEAKLDLAVFEDDAILIAEHWQQHPTFEVGPHGVPVDVEIFGEGRTLAPFENVEPPGVVGAADGHVVGDEVEDEAHAVLTHCISECAEVLVAAELWV